ncbi:toll/interleukin-1 receptor domain-containing protein [Phototrophicus methaneseepsis]|uniref:Toll/interleukin-1 receptor domain-containing protein n=1 Tax=Phototrophicus methaneseepsis TaxID=2710758 RepID=A0A7S8IEC8_9CHLR|nr:toll/interleukin-1 receptor domain-containing protein [Phototrophicus methaneseepsis]QPC82304.1 toll/interleukin-1 receptor domain-containing protein [Phototrophicus methaneseepsis]
MSEDGKIEWNPMEDEAPKGIIKRVEQFAYDLAWGVDKGLWGSLFGVTKSGLGTEWVNYANNTAFKAYLVQKWNEDPPDDLLLFSFKYLSIEHQHSRSNINYILTSNAFLLLKKPPKAPQIFVSYNHKESSALSLLVEARLKNKDSQIGIFIDKSINAGESWHPYLDEQLNQCEILVCLLTKETLKSTFVRKEINFALDNNKRVIPLCHAGYAIPDMNSHENDEVNNLLSRLNEVQAIYVEQPESAENYEIALLKLFIALGYSTI